MRETPPYTLADVKLRDGRDGKIGICHLCTERVTPRFDTGWPNAGYVMSAMHDHVCVGGHLDNDDDFDVRSPYTFTVDAVLGLVADNRTGRVL